MQEYINLQDQNFSFFGQSSKLIGEFNLSGPTHISGHVQGTIHMQDESELSITHTGLVEGIIDCDNLDIYGKFTGEVQARGKVKIYPTAQVEGSIKSKSLIVYPGARANIQGDTLE